MDEDTYGWYIHGIYQAYTKNRGSRCSPGRWLQRLPWQPAGQIAAAAAAGGSAAAAAGRSSAEAAATAAWLESVVA